MKKLSEIIDENGGLGAVLDIPVVKREIASVSFDMENLTDGSDTQFDMPGYKCGYDVVGDVDVLWCAAGGDWQIPVAFVLYADMDGQLHGYVPVSGNCYDRAKAEAYDSNGLEPGFEYKFDMDLMRTELLAHFDDVFPRTAEVPTGANQVVVKFKKVHPDAQLPKYAHEGDAGMDMCAVENVMLAIGKPMLVKTGLVAEIPIGYEIQVRPRSGLALKGVTVFNAPGTVDAKYRGEIGVVLYAVKGNTTISSGAVDVLEKGWQTDSQEYFRIEKGDRIAQLVLAPVTTCIPVETDEVNDTDRGTGGFGSTGV